MYKKPAFSVLMSNYNKGRYVEEAIRSVLAQTVSNWELVIVDDASTDNSVDIIQKYLGDKRIRFYRNEINIGCPATLNLMMEKSSAGIVGILDSDDVIVKETIETVLNAHKENPQCGFFYSRFGYYDKNLKFIQKGVALRMNSERNNIHVPCACAFRAYARDVYKKINAYDEKMIYGEERDLILKLEEVTDFFFIDKELYKYRVLPDSQSHRPVTKIIGALAHIDAKYNAFLRRIGTDIPNLNKNQIFSELTEGFFFSLKIKDFNRAKGYLQKSFKLNPFYFPGYFWIVLRILKFIPYRIYKIIFKSKNNSQSSI